MDLEPGTMVWISKTGEKFYNKNNCGNMDSSAATRMTVEEVRSLDKEACAKCY
ncbi:MAG: hypothetical protein K6G81_09860 [Lachnospiraceae bacterium]|nr:hypothetical protein [Lachnospiraceae bacterium]